MTQLRFYKPDLCLRGQGFSEDETGFTKQRLHLVTTKGFNTRKDETINVAFHIIANITRKRGFATIKTEFVHILFLKKSEHLLSFRDI